MCTLDDKILGEKVHNYCSSSEDEGEDDEAGPPPQPRQTAPEVDGRRYNTGPKGVIEDYRRFKVMEADMRERAERERSAQAAKCITAKTWSQDREDKLAADDDDDDEDDSAFLEAYRRQRMAEIAAAFAADAAVAGKRFGKVQRLDRETFLEAVDEEDANVVVVVLISDSTHPACRATESAFSELAADFPVVKFCRVEATDVGASLKFKMEAVPAVVAYKGGEVIGNFVRLQDEIGDEICAGDLESYLVEHGVLSAGGGGGGCGESGWRESKDDDSDDD